jgi:hypothetical protein
VVIAAEHLGQALRLLEAEASEIEHRMSFVRAAIEAFGLDADSLLMDVIAEEERTVLHIDVPEAVVLPTNWVRVERPTQSPEELNGQFAVVDLAPETAQQDDPEPPRGRTPEGRWDWDVVACEIGEADATGCRRAAWLGHQFEVPSTTAQWMVKRCREQGLIDADRPAVNHQAARDAAAAAL